MKHLFRAAARAARWHVHHALVATLLCLVAPPAGADAQSAVQALFANMQAAGLSFGPAVDAQAVTVQDTLVQGLYLVRLRSSGESLGFINDTATLVGGGKRGFSSFDQPGRPARRLTSEELLQLRAEILAAIDYRRLVPLRYGSGGGRRILEISAVDCPSCQQFEEALASLTAAPGQLDTTLYLVPSALVPTEDGGTESWQLAASIWCADDAGRAWQDYWRLHRAPAASPCRLDARSAQREAGMLRNILRGTGLNVDYTPTFVLEDGTLAPAAGPRTASWIRQNLDAVHRPATSAPPPQRWLARAAP